MATAGSASIEMSSRLLLLGGSLARPSHTGSLLRAVEELLMQERAEVVRLDLAEQTYSPADPSRRGDGSWPFDAALSDLRRHAARADGFVIASPVYHHSYSGLLKNMLDHLSGEQFSRKPVALLSNSGGSRSSQAVDHLRLVIRALGAIAIPTDLVTSDADYRRHGSSYRLADHLAETRLRSVVAELLWFVERLRTDLARRPEALRARVAAIAGMSCSNERK
jgi:NAD(P)H-dependent FMN reductase